MSSLFWKRRANGDRYAVAQVNHPTQGRITKTFSTRQEANKWIASMETNSDENSPALPSDSIGCMDGPNGMQTSNVSAPNVSSATSGTQADSGADRSHEQRKPVNSRSNSHNRPSQKSGTRDHTTLAEAIDRYLREIMPHKRSTRAPTQQLSFWRYKLGDHPIHKITPAMIAKAKSDLLTEPSVWGKQRKTSTINRYLAILCHVYTIAMKEWFLVQDNPALKVRKLKEPQSRDTFLSKSERATLLNALATEPELLQTVVKLALYTGMRLGEIMGLRWRQIDLERSRLVLETTKNGRPRGVPLVGSALEVITAWAAQHQAEPDALLFPGTDDASKPFDIRRGWNRLRTRIGMPELHFHDLRHCTASYMAMSGATPQEIADVLGHRTLEMVKRYAHLSDDHSRTALTRMAEKLDREDKEG